MEPSMIPPRTMPTRGFRTSDPWSADPFEILESDQHIARLGAVGWAEDARVVQLVDDARGASVADLEAALQERRRPQLVLDDHLRGLAEQLVALLDARRFAIRAHRFRRLPLPH